MKIFIGNKQYNVEIAETEEQKSKGLQGRTELKEDEGMLFIFDPPQRADFWMQDTVIPLDIIFIDEDGEVMKVAEGKPNDDTLISCNNTTFVLEVNTGSGIQKGDELEFDEESDEGPVMKILAPDGSAQYELWGGERIFRRAFTKQLIQLVKKAENAKTDNEKISLYKRIGKKMFKELDSQDSRQPEYVELPS